VDVLDGNFDSQADQHDWLDNLPVQVRLTVQVHSFLMGYGLEHDRSDEEGAVDYTVHDNHFDTYSEDGKLVHCMMIEGLT
jgi:hypothetical protein